MDDEGLARNVFKKPDDTCDRPIDGLRNKDITMDYQLSVWPLSADAASFIQNLKPLLIKEEPIKMSTNIRQFSNAEKIAALTHRYLELKLPLQAALGAAEADLQHLESLSLRTSGAAVFSRFADRSK